MPHTNITAQRQKVYTKQNPSEFVFVEPGDTIQEEALRVLPVEPEPKPPAAEEPGKPKEKKRAKKTVD